MVTKPLILVPRPSARRKGSWSRALPLEASVSAGSSPRLSPILQPKPSSHLFPTLSTAQLQVLCPGSGGLG